MDTLRAGDAHYTAYVGPPNRFDFMAATQFRLLTALGLRENHKLLDFGCGSLRAGRLFIPYLEPGNYFGIEPNEWLISDGIRSQLGDSISSVKRPSFLNNSDFTIPFAESFDFILAQSIFSHAGPELVRRALASFAEHLDGLAAVTFVEGARDTKEPGWIYPACINYTPKTIRRMIREAGLHGRRLFWFHPGQTWYVLAKSPALLPSRWSILTTLGGESPRETQFQSQGFFANRMRQVYKLTRDRLRH